MTKSFIFGLLSAAYTIINMLIIIRCLLSFLPLTLNNAFTNFVYGITEPMLKPVRDLLNLTPLRGMMIDLSPLVLYMILMMLYRLLTTMLVLFFSMVAV